MSTKAKPDDTPQSPTQRNVPKLEYPLATVLNIAKRSFPPKTMFQSDMKLAIHRVAVTFPSFLSVMAQDSIASVSKTRKTIKPSDIIATCKELKLDFLIEPLTAMADELEQTRAERRADEQAAQDAAIMDIVQKNNVALPSLPAFPEAEVVDVEM